MKPQNIYVICNQGCVEAVVDENGHDLNDNVNIIDFDMMENGDCPVCWSEHFDGDKCQECGFDANDPDGETQSAISARLAMYQDK